MCSRLYIVSYINARMHRTRPLVSPLCGRGREARRRGEDMLKKSKTHNANARAEHAHTAERCSCPCSLERAAVLANIDTRKRAARPLIYARRSQSHSDMLLRDCLFYEWNKRQSQQQRRHMASARRTWRRMWEKRTKTERRGPEEECAL